MRSYLAPLVAGLALLLVLVDVIAGAQQRSAFDADAFVAGGADYDVEIVRDGFGVPHIYGERDADVAFGLAWAQAEDDIATIEEIIPLYRGESARFAGFEAAPVDYLIQWLGAREAVEASYEAALSADVRAVIEAYAAGLNYYAGSHPDQVDQRLYPITAIDLVTAFSVQHVFFHGFQRDVQKVFDGAGPISEAPQQAALALLGGDVPIGSNAIAVGPSRSADGATHLLGNSHQPLTGPLAWYEVQVQSDEGWRMHGGLFPGSPMITVGARPELAWGVTVNQPDLVDVYVIERAGDDGYRLDGEVIPFEARTAKLRVRLLGNLYWTVEREILETRHGPALETDHGLYAFRFPGHREIRQPEQWYRMNRATNFEEWRAAMGIGAIASFNFVYGDADGHIGLFHNSRSPERAAGWDWKKRLPGDRSDLIWDEVQAFEDNPQVIDPEAGYVHSANQTPFRVTDPAEDADRDAFAPEYGFPTRMTNRAVRGLELLAADEEITREEFEAIKFDVSYAEGSRAVAYVDAVQNETFEAPRYAHAQAVLTAWDRSTTLDNRQAALAVCVLSEEWKAEQGRRPPPEVRGVFTTCVDDLIAAHGDVEVPWAEVNRLRRGEVNLPLAGGPDTLRAIYGIDPDEDGTLTAVGGDGLVVFAEWDTQGRQLLRTIHQYGSASTRPTSRHYADQAEMFANHELRTIDWDRDAVRAAAESITRLPLQ